MFHLNKTNVNKSVDSIELCDYQCFFQRLNGHRGTTNRLGQSSAPPGALLLLGHAGLGLLHRRFRPDQEGDAPHLWPGAEQAVSCLLLLPAGERRGQPGRVRRVSSQRAAGLA